SNGGGVRRRSGGTWREMWADGRAMKRGNDVRWSQVLMAATTPRLLKAAMVDGRPDLGVMASGQVVGVIDDLPTCEELIGRIVKEAAETIAAQQSVLLSR